MYEKGQGVPQDYKEAVKWYRKAAEQGDASGQFMLGDMYWEGTGVPKDAPTAYMWTNIAAATGDKNFVIGREALTELMNPSQIEQGQELTRACVARNYKGC
jgi:TPR repeat protein